MSIDPAQWTYGAELEWPDVDVRTPLPPGWGWSRTDYTVVNSNGTANDPLHRHMLYGGELNTPVTHCPDELLYTTEQVWRLLRPGHNYRSNLHIHVGVPRLAEDLPLLKQLADYTWRHLPQLWPHIDPLETLLEAQPTPDAQQAAAARLQHSQRSRHYTTSAARHAQRMQATTVEQFLAAEVPTAKNGRPAWHLASREAVNLRALRKHGTVEFRCFAAPRAPLHMAAAATFAQQWLLAAFTNADPLPIATGYGALLPRQVPFDLALEQGWRYTNFHTNRRSLVVARLQAMGHLP